MGATGTEVAMVRNTAKWQHGILSLLCFKVRNTATGAWRENTATATTASARMGSGCKAKATVGVVVEVDTIEDFCQSKMC